MKLKDEALWQEGLANNTDPYGACCYRFCERWADLMENAIGNGETVAECAERLSHEADTEGITGFMYGVSVGILASVWEHGEDLRRWHNIDTQIGDEGERANESGGILNPAVINIG